MSALAGRLSALAAISPDARLLVAAAGWVLAAAAAVLFPVLQPAAWALGLGLVALVVADAARLLARPKLRIERRAPERLEVGRTAELEVALHNSGAAAIHADVVDELPLDLRATDPVFRGLSLAPGERITLRYPVTPTVRGDRALGPLLAMVESPLGLLRRRVIAGSGEVLRVRPDTTRFLRPEALAPKRVMASLGVKPAQRRGEGMDFESLREYVPGDDPRRIDWRATARRGRLVSRLYQHERNHAVVVAIDASRLMGGRVRREGRTKLDCAVDSALALVYAALHNGDRAGLTVFDRERRVHLEPRARRADLGAFVDALSPIQSRLVEADYRVLAQTLLARRQRRALVVLLTDFAAGDAATTVAPLALLARRHRVLVVALRDRSFDALEPGASDAAWSERQMYRNLVLDDLLREREETLARLRQQGLHTLDLASEDVTARVLNRYLEMRYGEV